MEKEIFIKGCRVHYQKHGNGLPIMLLHGFGETGSVWKEQIEFFKNKYQLLIPDLPGSGKSTLGNEAESSMDFFAEVVFQILKKEGLKKMVLIGHSMGGYISLAFAKKYPERLIALGLFHSSAYADDAEKISIRKKGIAFIKKNGAAPFLESSIPNLFADAGNPLKQRLLLGAGDFSDHALIHYYEAMISRPDSTRIIAGLAVPFLMIIGEKDKAVLFESALKQTNLANLSFIYILRKSGHMGMWEEKDKANKILAKFLDQF